MTAKNEATKPCKKCGALTPDRANGTYCKKCTVILRAEYMTKYRRDGAQTPRKGFVEKSTVCQCPTCKKLFKKLMNWTGRAEYPPIYCLSCGSTDAVQYIETVEYEMSYMRGQI